MKVINTKLKNSLKYFWTFWEKHSILCTLIVSIIPLTLYFLGCLDNIRENTGSIITFAVGIFTLDGVFLTLLITLKSSPVMERLKKHFSNLHQYFYEEIKKQTVYCLCFLVINIVIAIVGIVNNVYIAAIGVFIWSYFFIYIVIGFTFTLKVIMNLAINEVDSQKKMR